MQTDQEPPPTPNDSDPPALREAKSFLHQLHSAKPANFAPQDLAHVAGWMTSLLCRFGPNGKDTKPADDWIAAQLLTIAPLGRLTELFYELQDEGKQTLGKVWRYSYFASVAAQRLRGISPTALRQARQIARAPLKLMHPGAPAAEAANHTAPLDTAALINHLAKKRTF